MSLSASDYMQGVKDICVSVLKNETSFLLDAATIIFLSPDINNYLVMGDSLKTFNPDLNMGPQYDFIAWV